MFWQKSFLFFCYLSLSLFLDMELTESFGLELLNGLHNRLTLYSMFPSSAYIQEEEILN